MTTAPHAAASGPWWLAKALASAVTGRQAWHHLKMISEATHAHGGNRVSGSPGYDAAAEYVTKTLTDAGYRVQRQEFTFPDYEVVAETGTETAPVSRELHPLLAYFSVSTPETGVSAALAEPAGRATGCAPEDYAGGDVTGKIVLVDAGGCATSLKQVTAADAGAIAMVMNVNYGNPTMNIRHRVVPPETARIPTATLTRAEAEKLRADADQGEVTLHLDLRTKPVTTKGYNLIADTPSGTGTHTVVVGSHLDSVDTTPGSNDNAAAAAMQLEIARQLAHHDGKVANRVRFAWWDAEEKGLVGSRYYVDQLSPRQRGETGLYLNLEMIGSPNFARQVYNGRTPGGPAPAGSEQITKTINDYFAGRNLPTVGLELDDRSDHSPFIKAGIPAGGVNAGAEALKPAEWVPLFGGIAGEMLDHCYHQPCDTLDNVNPVIFDQFGRAIAWTTGRYAVETLKPENR
ncbi:M28 family peptidase [Amycolatopsis regifaucium]|uniref:M28 family peptidase n=1 Tax=Amycolatopsis regifaucium TaxID=546365 RepID=UPI001C434BB9|nr:M28 family peptidase [Amycolatopsis regifaucium]